MLDLCETCVRHYRNGGGSCPIDPAGPVDWCNQYVPPKSALPTVPPGPTVPLVPPVPSIPSVALVLLVLSVPFLPGCTAFDRTYRHRVKSFTLTEAIGPAYLSQRWEYNPTK